MDVRGDLDVPEATLREHYDPATQLPPVHPVRAKHRGGVGERGRGGRGRARRPRDAAPDLQGTAALAARDPPMEVYKVPSSANLVSGTFHA